jgi:hypothetical protein
MRTTLLNAASPAMAPTARVATPAIAFHLPRSSWAPVHCAALREPVLEAPLLEAPLLEAPLLEAPLLEAPVLEAPLLEAPDSGPSLAANPRAAAASAA